MKKTLSLILTVLMMFSLCTAVSALTPPEEVVHTSGDVKYLLESDDTAYIVGCAEDVTHLTIPSTVDGYKVRFISNYAFRQNKTLESVVVEDGIEMIGFEAFYQCTSLKSVTLPDSVRDIHRRAFDYTSVYTNQDNWKDGAIYIGNHLVGANEVRIGKTYQVKEGTVSINCVAFEDNETIEQITFPDSLKAIGFMAFSGCKNLEKADLPANLEHIGENAFSNCSKLESIVIPPTLKVINSYAFSNCDNAQITLNNTLTHIEMGAFRGNEKLEELTLPQSLTSLGEWAFFGCNNLSTIDLPDSLTYIGSGVFGFTAFSENKDNWTGDGLYLDGCLLEVNTDAKGIFTVAEGTEMIAGTALYCCEDITAVNLPEGLTFIGAQAFGDCFSLTRINIPESLCRISPWTFSGCTALERIYLHEDIINVGMGAFIDCTNLRAITVASKDTTFGEMAIGWQSITDPEDGMHLGYELNKNTTIRGYSGSTAQEYAAANSIPFTEMTDSTLTGDTDMDGKLSVKDATAIQKFLADLYDLTDAQHKNADTTADGSLTVRDATAIQKTLADL